MIQFLKQSSERFRFNSRTYRHGTVEVSESDGHSVQQTGFSRLPALLVVNSIHTGSDDAIKGPASAEKDMAKRVRDTVGPRQVALFSLGIVMIGVGTAGLLLT